MHLEKVRHSRDERHTTSKKAIITRDEALRASRNKADLMLAELHSVRGSLQEKVTNLEKELAIMNKEIDQQARERACNVVKALIVKNVNLDLDYSFLPNT